MIESLRDAVIFNLDHCAQLFRLDVCRVLFNKPLLIANDLILRVLYFISSENTFNFLASPFRQVLTILVYLGFFTLLYLIFKKANKKIDLSFNIPKKVFISVFILSLFVGIFLRIFDLNKVPSGFTIDEISIGYNAYSIGETGADQYGQKYPLTHFKSVGDYKLPFYIYVVSFFQKFVEDKIISERIPSALFGILLIIVTYFLGKNLFNKNVGLFSSILISISSWHIYHSRLGLETNAGLLFSALTILLLFLSLKKSVFFIFASLSFVLAIYTHHSYWIFLPPVIFLFFILHLKQIKINKNLLVALIVVILSVIPFIFENNNSKGTRFNQTVFAKYKNYDLKTQILNQYVRAYSFITWYGPSAFDLVDVIPNRGIFYIFEFPLLILGIIVLLIKRNRVTTFLLLWLALYPFPLLVTGDITAARMYQVLPLPFLMEGLGLTFLFKKFRFLIPLFIVVIIFSVLSLSSDLFSTSPFLYSRYTNYGEIAIVNYIKGHNGNFFIEEPLFDKLYLYYFFNRLPGQELKRKNAQGVLVTAVKNINIVERGYLPDLSPKNIMISFPEDIPHNYKKIGDIKLIDNSSYASISVPR